MKDVQVLEAFACLLFWSKMGVRGTPFCREEVYLTSVLLSSND